MTDEAQARIAVESCPEEAAAAAASEGWREQSASRRTRRRFSLKHMGRASVKSLLRRAGIYATVKPGANADSCLVRPEYLFEEHHFTYGMPWALGRDHADHILARGLEPHHTLLDFGCGALRVGIWLIPYLDAGNYFGLDSHEGSLGAAVEYEIPLHGLESKRPRLLLTQEARCDHFAVQFDRVVALSVFNHMGRDLAQPALVRVAASMAPGGRLMASERMPLDDDEMRQEHGLRLDWRGRVPSRFVQGATLWQEYVKE